MKKVLLNGKIFISDQIITNHKVLYDETVLQILPASAPHGEAEPLDLHGAYAFPGFIDVHTHGVLGADVMDASLQSLATICQSLAGYGVTRFLPTTMTMPAEMIRKALENVRQYLADPVCRGAKILGVHLEGPFISRTHKGAQDDSHITKPDWSLIEDYHDLIKLITLAVEEDDNFEFIRKSHPGIRLSIGHSNADFETALASYDLGVTHCTHCFNAMSPLHHRKPGVVGAVFTKKYETEFIPDGVHIHPGFLETFVRIIGKEQAILITDSIRASGMPEGDYTLGGQKIHVTKTDSRLESGALAGSILTMDKALRNMVDFTSLPLTDLLPMASLHPARSIGVDHLYGSIDVGKAADFVIMNEDLTVQQTIVDGQIIYQA